MLYIIIGLLLLIFFVSFFGSKKKTIFRENAFFDDDVESIAKKIVNIFREPSVEENGIGINPISMLKKIKSAKCLVAHKISVNEKIWEEEKWLYENFYLIYRYVYTPKDKLRDVPHVNGIPRIVLIAKCIVNNSINSLSGEKIRKIFNILQERIPLKIDEMEQFNNALSFALLEVCYILADRILMRDKMKRKAKKFNDRYVDHNTYLYFACKNGVLQNKYSLEKHRITAEFNTSVMENVNIAKMIFTGLREVDTYLPYEYSVKLLDGYSIIDKVFPLKGISISSLKSYFAIINKVAKDTSFDESTVAGIATESAIMSGVDVSEILFDHKRELKNMVKKSTAYPIKKKSTKGKQALYISLLYGISAISSALVSIFLDVFLGIVSIIPIFFIIENVLNYLYSELLPSKLPLSLSDESVSYNNRTAVVVAEYVSNFEQFLDGIKNLQILRASNGGENIEFCLLLDTKAEGKQVSELDEKIIEYCNNSYEEDIYVFLRKKKEIKNKFISYERKRGAIYALNKLFVGVKKDEFLYISSDKYFVPKYIVTLDGDNGLVTGDVVDMVNIISHPYYKKYDMMALHSRYNLFSIKNKFSLRYLQESGLEEYPIYTDLYMRAFGREIFCGKGIYRLNSFYNKTEGVFPDNKILSHDIIEGAVMTTGGATTILEDAPRGFLSDRERRKRWMRGDIQLLPFLLGRWKNNAKERYRGSIEPFYSHIMFRNVLSAIQPLCIFLGLLYGICTDPKVVLGAIAISILPFFIDIIKILRSLANGTRVQYIMKSIFGKVKNFVEEFFFLGYYAVDNSIIFISTLTKMIRKGNLLQWKTYRDSQSDNRPIEYLKEFIPSICIISIIGLVVAFFTPIAIMVAIYVIVCSLCIIRNYRLSSMPINPRCITDSEREELLKYAKSTYKYFAYMNSFSPLIGDNLQIKPYKGVANITSPTNIGFSLLAEICAYELGFVPLREALRVMSDILNSVDKLPKWEGNLFNWYDINEKKPKTKFVSSVDSGNFLACLIVVKSFFAEHDDGINQLKAEILIRNTNLASLFDKQKNQFFIGFDGEKYVGHYDNINSESRILNEIYTAYYSDKSNRNCLKRDYSKYRGNTLLSWSGTSFEGLMPSIFIHSPYGSLLYSTEYNTAVKQSTRSIDGVWGIGESGYNSFDENLKYQYHAFGIEELSLRGEPTEYVISPYSSIICLEYLPEKVLSNMVELEKIGGFGEYGFYESIDYIAGKRIVRSHMSHHQGMILCSITNYLSNGLIRKLFYNDLFIRSAMNNANELRNKSNNSIKLNDYYKKSTITKNNYSKKYSKIEHNRCVFALSDGEYRVIMNGFGGGYTQIGNDYLNTFSSHYEEKDGMFFYVKDVDGILHSPTYLPIEDESIYCVTDNGDEVIYDNLTCEISQKVTLLNGLSGEVRRLVANPNDEVFFFSSVVLNGIDAYLSHPTFNGIFINAYVKDDILIIKRTSRGKDEEDHIVGVRVEGLKEIFYECNLANLFRNSKFSSPLIFDNSCKKTFPSLGDVIHPCIGIFGKLNGTACDVAIIFGNNEEKIIDSLQSLPIDMYSYGLLSDDKVTVNSFTKDILSELLYKRYSDTIISDVTNEFLTNFRKFTQNRRTVSYHFDEKLSDNFDTFLTAMKELRVLGIDCLPYVFIDSEEDRGFVEKKLNESFLKATIIPFDGDYLPTLVDVKTDLSFKETPIKITKKSILDQESTLNNPQKTEFSNLYRSGNGGFDEMDDYVVDEATLLPYSNVISAKYGGMIVTNNGGGFFYFDNSRECKISRFDNEPIKDDYFEYLFVRTPIGCHRINCDNVGVGYTLHKKGKTTFHNESNGIATAVSYSNICDGKIRVMEVKGRNNESYAEFIYGLYPCLGWKYDPTFLHCFEKDGVINLINLSNGQRSYIKFLSNFDIKVDFSQDSVVDAEYFCDRENFDFFILFSQDIDLIRAIDSNNILYFFDKEEEIVSGYSAISVSSSDRSLNILSRWLPYQVISSRINGKLGYYQVGGANGFRDRLQDASSIIYFNPELAKEIILDSAMHQYVEGDVMHWWHPPKFGLRTRITDDKLFLPLVVAEYVKATHDYDILDIELPYLQSSVLATEESTRYEDPPYTDWTESLLEHCRRAIKSSLRYGEHNLLIMGGGDWNDGMDEVCAEGYGESVFNSMFCYEVITKIADFFDTASKKDLLRIANDLKININNHAFNVDRYMRLYTDDGKWIGVRNSEILELDLLVQCYSVISGVADIDRANVVLDSCRELVDRELGIIKLLTPSLTKDNYLGYISAYPKGVRENGGQYTHAAIWYLIALTIVDRQDEAYEYFSMINPVEKLRDVEKNEAYKGEPYVLSGDVYSNEYNRGRAGWTWYTGSAGWTYRLLIEYFFGLKKRGNKLFIIPKLPKKLLNSVVAYKNGDKTFFIEFKSSDDEYITVDGERLAEDYIDLSDKEAESIKVFVKG